MFCRVPFKQTSWWCQVTAKVLRNEPHKSFSNKVIAVTPRQEAWMTICAVSGEWPGIQTICHIICKVEGGPGSLQWSYLAFADPIITLETKLTMALAGCSGSCSANRWHTFSVALPPFLATKPKILWRDGSNMFSFLKLIIKNNLWLGGPGSWLGRPGSWLLRPSSWLGGSGSWLRGPSLWLDWSRSWLGEPGSWLGRPNTLWSHCGIRPGRAFVFFQSCWKKLEPDLGF